MHFLYIAPRYHTNQIPIMKGLKREGHEITFLSQYAGKLEDYTTVKPIVVGYSPVYLFFDALYVRLMKKKNPYAGDKKIKCGIPRMGKLAKEIKASKADVAILRERSVYSICANMLCKRYGIPTIMYNQSPLWEEEIKNDLPHKLVRMLTPKVRMTPVLGIPGEDKVKEEGAMFIPFVMEPAHLSGTVKSTEDAVAPTPPETAAAPKKSDGVTEIFCIGKYEKRKNHKMLAEVLSRLPMKEKVHLTIAGECTTGAHENYYRELEELISAKGLAEQVTLYRNLKRQEVDAIYAKSHLFVIPSTAEPASISQLEAMAHGLPVICSDKNGTACYVKDGVNGYLFADNNQESLLQVLQNILSDAEGMQAMGEESLRAIKEEYQIQTYLEGVLALLAQIKGA